MGEFKQCSKEKLTNDNMDSDGRLTVRHVTALLVCKHSIQIQHLMKKL
jgi:hypothetical protein